MAKVSKWAASAMLAVVRVLGVAWALAWAWSLVVAARESPNQFASRFECGTDPTDFLRIGELLERSTLRFIVAAHCANARYLPDDRIELHYGGIPVEVETTRVSIGGTTYYKIMSVGGFESQ